MELVHLHKAGKSFHFALSMKTGETQMSKESQLKNIGKVNVLSHILLYSVKHILATFVIDDCVATISKTWNGGLKTCAPRRSLERPKGDSPFKECR